MKHFHLLLLLILILSFLQNSHSTLKKLPPLPILPLPTSSQLQWQQTRSSLSLFLHFGPNTFTNAEIGSGSTDPKIFNPTRFNPRQWVQVAKSNGFSRIILTAKHHDGFCLWPSDYTNYSVRASTVWRGGNGDVLLELAEAAKDEGVGLGFYLSPWDRHEDSYGDTLAYNEFYVGQLTELLTRYGDIKEVWLDGHKEGGKDMEYLFDTWFSLIHQLQPGAVIFSDAGPDVRWVGNENGAAGSTCWSLFNRSNAKIGDTDPQYSQEGDPWGHDWVPAECDVSIRPGWFWHASESPKSAVQLLDLYYKSVGRNSVLLLNVPPNSSGLISEEDIRVLREFREMRESVFSKNLAQNATVIATSTRGGDENLQFSPWNVLQEGIYGYWAPEENQKEWQLYFDLKDSVTFNVLEVQEPIQMGQRVISFHLETLNGKGQWETVASGTTVGFKRLLQFRTVKSQYLKFIVDEARADPLIAYLGVYMDAFSLLSSHPANTTSPPGFNSSYVLQSPRHNNSWSSAT